MTHTTFIHRLLVLLLVAAMIGSCLCGCFPSGAQDPNETQKRPLFDPDGDDDPLNPTKDTQPTQSTEPSEEATRPTEEDAPSEPHTDPTEESTEPTEESTEPTEETTEPIPADPIGYGIVIGDVLNVRSGPGTEHDTVGTLKFNTRIAILQRSGDWAMVEQGWIALKYVYIDGTVGPDGIRQGTVDGNGVNIRKGPGTGYGISATVNTGDKVEILHIVTMDGRKWGCTTRGWICMDFVKLDGASEE